MGKYNFVSGGAMAGNAISQFLAEREAQNRQQMLDRLAQEARTEQQRQQRETEGRQREQLDFQQQQEARVAAGQQATFDDLANQRNFTQVEKMVEGARPEDAPLDAGMVEKVQRQGFGSRLKQIPGVLMQGPLESGDESMRAEEVGITPEQTALRPGSKYLDAEAQRTFMEGQTRLASIAAGERAADSNAMRMAIAQLNARGDANSKALADQLAALNIQITQGKIDEQNTKRDAAAEAVTNARTAEQGWASGLLTELDRLQTATTDPKTGQKTYALNPEAQAVTGGARVPERIANTGIFGGADAIAAVKAITSKIAINTINDMKKQSKTGATGFGSLSGPELDLLLNAEQNLSRAQSEGRFNERLSEIREVAAKVLAYQAQQGTSTPNAGPAAGGATDPNARAAQFLKDRGRGNGR